MSTLTVFLLATLALLAVSWKSLRHPRSHGFARFFAWEAMLALLLLQIEHWFEDPWSWHQILSWLSLCASIVLVVLGTVHLRARGGQNKARQDAALFAFEKTSHLVTGGIFHYIRHPLYSSLLFLTWGICLKDPSWEGAALALVATFFLFRTAKADEAECLSVFGEAYTEYIKHSKRFVPFLI